MFVRVFRGYILFLLERNRANCMVRISDREKVIGILMLWVWVSVTVRVHFRIG